MKKAFYIVILALLALGLSNIALSLDPKKALKQYILEKWNTANGLPQNSVSSIIQSREGYIWFATQEGVARFDGSRFTVFDRINTPELGTSNIAALGEAPDGAIWFVGGFSISACRLQNGKFTGYNKESGLGTKPGNLGTLDSTGALWITSNFGIKKFDGEHFITFTRKDGLPSDTAFAIYPDHDHRVWIGTAFRLTMYENGKFVTYGKEDGLLSDTIYSMLEDHEGNMWFGTTHGLNKFSNGKFTSYTKKDGIVDEVIKTVFEDSKHQLYIGTPKGVEKFENGKFVLIPNKDGSPGNNINAIYEDKEGTLWVIPNQKGIQRLTDGALESFTTVDGLSENDVRVIFEDKEGSLWIGTYGGGLDRLRDTKFTTYTTDDGLSENLIQSVFEDRDHNWWIGTFNRGVNRYKDGKNTNFSTKDGLSSNAIQGMAEDSTGAIWIGTAAGLCRYMNGKFTKFTTKEGLLNNNIQSLMVDKSGVLWIGSFGGVTNYDKGKFSILYSEPNTIIFSLLQTLDGNIWVGGFNNLGFIENGQYVPYSLPDSISGVPIFSIYQDSDGTLWLGTAGNGIIRIKQNNFHMISPRNGLFDFNVYCMLEDKAGNIWTDCNKGIYRVPLSDLNDFCDGKIPSVKCIAYGTADGMKNVECNGGTMPNAWIMDDGRFAFSTVGGLATIYPSEIKLNMVPPSVVLEQMIVAQDHSDPKVNNVYPAGTEKFQFTYAGISFLGGDKVRYKYKLEPFETDWVDAGRRREAFYTHIPPGDYTFKVIAANNDGIWNDVGASTSFTLKPYFYESAWFITFCVIGFVGIGPGVYLMRVRQMKNKEKELTRIVEARTADLKKEKENVEKALTDLKEAQHQLVLSEKMASLGQLTAGIAHEIKNPLNFVNNFSTLSNDLMVELQQELDKKKDLFDEPTRVNIEDIIKDLRQNVTKINEHGKRADSIVRGMLLHSRGKTGERQMTDLNALLAEYTNLAYHGMRAQDSSFNVKIETHFDESIGQVNIVPQDLSRVFLNIINNGCYSANDKKKHIPAGFSPTISVSSKNLGDKFEVRIRDNGSGIPQSVIDKIFNPFFTTKPAGAGTGLGLSLSYDIVTQEHKGEIRVDTKEGEFAEFIITIPKNLA